jgi:hypothetical protein
MAVAGTRPVTSTTGEASSYGSFVASDVDERSGRAATEWQAELGVS